MFCCVTISHNKSYFLLDKFILDVIGKTIHIHHKWYVFSFFVGKSMNSQVVMTYGGFLKWGYAWFSSSFYRIFHELNHPAFGDSPFMETHMFFVSTWLRELRTTAECFAVWLPGETRGRGLAASGFVVLNLGIYESRNFDYNCAYVYVIHIYIYLFIYLLSQLYVATILGVYIIFINIYIQLHVCWYIHIYISKSTCNLGDDIEHKNIWHGFELFNFHENGDLSLWYHEPGRKPRNVAWTGCWKNWHDMTWPHCRDGVFTYSIIAAAHPLVSAPQI